MLEAYADAGVDEVAGWIRRHLPVTSVAGLPEISLHVADARSGLGRFLDGREGAGPPYWAHPWAGGLVLARHLLDHPGSVAGRRVIDLGCGSGLVGIAAARGGAAAVSAVDVDRLALVATGVNAALNDVRLETACADLFDGLVPDGDLIVIGDLFYDAALAARVLQFVERCMGAGLEVLIGDPGRATLPTARFEPISRINNANRLNETLAWSMLPTDGQGHSFKAAHCPQIAYVVRKLCGLSQSVTATEEALVGIRRTLLLAERSLLVWDLKGSRRMFRYNERHLRLKLACLRLSMAGRRLELHLGVLPPHLTCLLGMTGASHKLFATLKTMDGAAPRV